MQNSNACHYLSYMDESKPTAAGKTPGPVMQKVIDAKSLTLATLNGTIGAGIFVLPAVIGMQLGSYALPAYLICGLMLGSIMLCYAEIGSRTATSGGSYAYVTSVFGKGAGYVVNWLYVFGYGMLGSAALINVLADSLGNVVPVLATSYGRVLTIIVCVGLMACINIRGARQGVTVVKFFTILKILPLLFIVVVGCFYIVPSNLSFQQAPSLRSFGEATLVLFYAFAGFETFLGASGEIKNPSRTVPAGLLLGGLILMALYALLQTVTQGVLGNEVSIHPSAPLAAIASKAVGVTGSTLILIAAAISCYGCVSADVMATPRCMMAGANDGMFPPLIGRIHPRFLTPHFAIIVYASLILLFALTGGFRQLALMASACVLLVYLAVVLAMLVLRKRTQVRGPDEFRVPGGVTIPAIAIISIICLLSSLSKKEWWATSIFFGLILASYLVMKVLRKNPVPDMDVH
jgi:amino acid transporter